MRKIILGAIQLFLLFYSQVHAQEVLTNRISLSGPTEPTESDISLYGLPASSLLYGTLIDMSGLPGASVHGDLFYTVDHTNLVRYEYTLDKAADWYHSSYGAEFSPDTLSTLTPLESDPSISIGTDPFYLAVHVWAPLPELPWHSYYGWVELQNDGSSLTLLSSGFVPDKAVGLFVGTTTVVPEPSCLTLLAFGVAIFLVRRRACVL